jgi:hypothetical protein
MGEADERDSSLTLRMTERESASAIWRRVLSPNGASVV